MKGVCILLFCAAVASAQDQSSDVKKLLRYEDGKLEHGTALLFSLLLPGGGCFYAEREGEGAIIAIVSLGSAYWLYKTLSDEKVDRERILPPVFVLAGMKVIDIALSQKEVDTYNSRLKVKLGLALVPRGIGATVFLYF